MLPLIEFRVLDKNSIHFGVDIQTLMNNAGMAISDFILDTWRRYTKRTIYFYNQFIEQS